MRAYEFISEAIKKRVTGRMSDQEKYELAQYVYHWLSGNFMKGEGDWSHHMNQWKLIHSMFPPRFPRDPVRLYRLVTLPLEFADKQDLVIAPGHGPLTSWSKTLSGIDAVMGVATDMNDDADTSCRIAVTADIPTSWILATHTSMRDCFMSLTHDYFEKYPEVTEITKEPKPEGGFWEVHRTTNPGWPGDENGDFRMDDVGFLHDVMNRPGGHYKQYEVVVNTPPKMEVKLVRVYRRGKEILRYGNEDPHN
jgi:hypothetical protein